mgnify:CR=1 FL=1
MNSSRALTILLFVTIIAVAGAVLVMVREQATISTDIETAQLFPDLGARLGDVAELRIEDAGGSVIIKRNGERWTLPGKFGYPADQGRVRAAILAVTSTELLETKTADPALYGRLGVQNQDQDGSRAVRLSLLDEGGNTLAAVLIGDRPPGSGVYSASGRDASGRAYVRKPDEVQSWLASGVPDLTADLGDWLDDQLLSLVQERVKRVTVRHADGATIRIYRESPGGDNGDENFTIADLPGDRRVRTADGPASLAMGLAFLSFDDVKPADAVDRSGGSEVIFTAFDGLEITVRIKDAWAHFSAAYDPAVAEEGEGGAVLPPSPPDGAAEARRINERYGQWAYKLPTYKAGDLVPTLDDLTEEAAAGGKSMQKAP